MGINDEGALIQSPYALGHIPEVYRKYDMDKLGKLILITRGTTKFLQYTQHKFGLKSKRVDTFEPRIQDINEPLRYIEVAEISSATDASNTKLKVLNKFGKPTVKVRDILTVDSLWYEPTKSTPYASAFGLNNSDYYIKNEQVMVTGVGEADSAGSGYTNIWIRRGYASTYAYPSYSTATLSAAPSNPPPITTSMKLHRSGNAFAHGTGYPAGDFANPYIDGNYLQEMKWAIEIVKEQELEKTFLNDSGYTPMSLATMLKAREMMWEYEKHILYSIKTKTSDERGNPVYTTNGVMATLKGDAEHIVDYTRGGAVSTINYMDINTMGDSIFAWGGGTTKTAFTGGPVITRLQNAFFNKFLFTDEEMTKEFSIPVYKLKMAAGDLELVATYGLQEMGWVDRMLIWDFSIPSMEKTVFNGSLTTGGKTMVGDFDLYKEDNVQLPGEQIQKTGYIHIGGFQFRAPQYHGMVVNLPNAVANYSTETAA